MLLYVGIALFVVAVACRIARARFDASVRDRTELADVDATSGMLVGAAGDARLEMECLRAARLGQPVAVARGIVRDGDADGAALSVWEALPASAGALRLSERELGVFALRLPQHLPGGDQVTWSVATLELGRDPATLHARARAFLDGEDVRA